MWGGRLYHKAVQPHGAAGEDSRSFKKKCIGTKSEYRKGCFHFLFDRMEFYKEGRPVELSKTERRILQLLVFHEGQVITRDRLMEWGMAGWNRVCVRTMRSPSASVVSGISWKMPRPGRNISGLFMEKDMCGSQTDTTGERDERNIFLHFLCAGGSGVRDRRHSF